MAGQDISESEVNKVPGFRIPSESSYIPSSPEDLFRDLKDRSPHIPNLWSHQADILRAYCDHHLRHQNVAIELPTGTGKTLVGLLIGEYLRRAKGYRVVYLCPTKQLATQVASHASQLYGIKVSLLIGRQAEYDPVSLSAYRMHDRIAVTTYAGLFNTNPAISDPQIIIMDDAHAGESFIASLWSLEIDRFDSPGLYKGIVALFADVLSPGTYRMALTEQPTLEQLHDVDVVPATELKRRETRLVRVIDDMLPDDLRFSWGNIQDHLDACNLFISWRQIVIRPYIPPTLTHQPFAGATQRILMSATLGESGELERATGLREISRIPVPAGWDRHSNGRRLILFPSAILDQARAEDFTRKAIQRVDRALVITPTWHEAKEFRDRVLDRLDYSVLTASDIEASLAAFTTSRKCVLLLANRYDGLDLPAEDCRLEVLAGYPAGVNLQEKFLWRRLGASSVLQERIRTRFMQGIGRCTRGATDYAVVIILGEDMTSLCQRSEFRNGLHPEIQAEIMLGMAQETTDHLIDAMEAFLTRDESWKQAEDFIASKRDVLKKVVEDSAHVLRETAKREVDFAYALWGHRYEEALTIAREVSDRLEGAALAPYRSWWYYLQGTVASFLIEERGLSSTTPAELFERASKASPGVSWFTRYARRIATSVPAELPSLKLALAVENIENTLMQLGVHGRKFHRFIEEMTTSLAKREADPFEQGLTQLGKALGFDSYRPGGEGAPDSVWKLGEDLYVVFEAKSHESPDGPIGTDWLRQAEYHLQWVHQREEPPDGSTVTVVLVTDRVCVSAEALDPHDSLVVVSPQKLREVARRVSEVLSQCRVYLDEHPSEVARTRTAGILVEARLDPDQLLESLCSRRAKDLPRCSR